MKSGRWMIVAGVALFGMLVMPTQGFGQGGGKGLFTAQKCTKCHSVKSQGIAAKPTDADTKVHDLSKTGAERNAAWIAKYLKKEEAIKGKKHKTAWKGTDAELTELSNWLGGLK